MPTEGAPASVPTDQCSAEHVFQRNDCEQILGVFSVVIGYFLFDLGICLYYRYEMWQGA